LWRIFGPVLPKGAGHEALRAGMGALLGLGLLALAFAYALPFALHPQSLWLIAPFGASAVLLFAVPNSPLAQPWSAIVGNVLAAVIGVAVVLTVVDPTLRVVLALGLTIPGTILARAVHPPAGAVAMTAALNPELVHALGFGFALAPVGLGTLALVLLAMVWARMTGRHYPFRLFETPGPFGTADHPPVERLGLSEAELAGILENYRQSLNLGVEDLARLIGAAEMQAATHRTGPLTAADIMSRDLVTVSPDTALDEVARLFRHHGFTSIPVVGPENRFFGVIFQIHLIRQARDDAFRLDRGFAAAMRRLTESRGEGAARAGDIMAVASPRATPTTPVAALLPQLADGYCDAVPVLSKGRIVGIVTRTDMIAALARRSLSA
jgi:CBS domain-containing membrane protein